MKIFDPWKELLGVLSRRLLNSSITRTRLSYRSYPFLHHCIPSSIAKVHNLVESQPYREHDRQQEKYWKDGFVIEAAEEENACHIRRAILKVKNGTADDVVRALQCDESCRHIQLTTHLADGLLHKFGDDWKSALGFFRWADSQFGFEHSSYARDKMVDLLGKVKQLDLMWDLVDGMCGQGLVTLGTVAKIMRRLAGLRKWDEVIRVFDDIGSMGLEKNTESMNLLLDSLCKERKAEVAREVYLKLKAHIPPDAYTFNIFVHGWCNARRIDEAMWTIQEMKSIGFRPSVITYSTILQAHCNRFNYRKVYELLDEMIAEGCPPNVVTYTSVISSLAKSQEFEEVTTIITRMESSGCKPDTLFYNSLINILGKAGQVHEANHIFKEEMQTNGVSRNLSTYNAMISVFCHHGQEQDALDVLEEMENSSCRPVLRTYIPLLKLCFQTGKLDQLNNLLSDLVNKHHLSLDLDTYKLLIHGMCSARKIEWACHLFDEMIGQEISPSIRTCKMLIFELEEKRMDGAAERIKRLMEKMINSPCV